jgi:hypothetical protein
MAVFRSSGDILQLLIIDAGDAEVGVTVGDSEELVAIVELSIGKELGASLEFSDMLDSTEGPTLGKSDSEGLATIDGRSLTASDCT